MKALPGWHVMMSYATKDQAPREAGCFESCVPARPHSRPPSPMHCLNQACMRMCVCVQRPASMPYSCPSWHDPSVNGMA